MRAEDAAAIARLAGLAARGVRGIAERTHVAVQQSVYRVMGTATGASTSTVGRAHDGYVRGIYWLVDLGLRGAELLGSAAAERMASGGPPLTDSARAAATVAIINGLYGDRLHREGHSLAPDMTLRVDGADVTPTEQALAAAYREPSGRLVIFVHGLMESEASWTFRSEHRHGRPDVSYASQLAAELDWTPLLLRYNTGLPIADNGGALGALLARAVDNWPVPVEQIALVGHSMGGLVVHSALAQAAGSWAERVCTTVTLGTPYLGAPLARGVAAVERTAVEVPAARWLGELLTARSEGIKDLGAGLGAHEALSASAGSRRHYLVYATVIPGETGPLRDLVGDAVVPTGSAVGGYELPLDPDRGVTVINLPGRHHQDLLNDPDVYVLLRGWLEDDRSGAAQSRSQSD